MLFNYINKKSSDPEAYIAGFCMLGHSGREILQKIFKHEPDNYFAGGYLSFVLKIIQKFILILYKIFLLKYNYPDNQVSPSTSFLTGRADFRNDNGIGRAWHIFGIIINTF